MSRVTVSYNCLYCNNTWLMEYYSFQHPADPECDKCKEKKNIKIKTIDKQDVFGYDSDKPKEDAYIKRK